MLYDTANNRAVASHRWLTIYAGYREEPFLEASPGVLMVPVDADNNVLFVLEPTIFDASLALMLPGGSVDEGETPVECAVRELQEEIGLRPGRVDLLGELHPMARHARWSNFICLTRDLTESWLEGDEPYTMTIRRVPLTDFESLIAGGELRDAGVIAALYMTRAFIAKNG
jgi:8-oxo-dGTP pyrophosphatase MutT (NUDIX family)